MKTILLTGSSSGIGRAIAEKLLSENYKIIGLARRHEKFTPTENYFPYSIDFSKIAELEKQLKSISKEHPEIMGIICCAGYGEFCDLEQFTVSNMQKIINVNFLSQAIVVKTFLSQLKQKKAGKIILLGSECALDGQKKGTIYCASKFALRGFAQALRKECVTANIAVTLINPGLVDTPFFDNLSFSPALGLDFSIQPKQIADIVWQLFQTENHCVFEEINLQPLKKVIKTKNGIDKMTELRVVHENNSCE